MGRFGDGLGLSADVLRAADDAVAQAVEPLGDRTPDLLVCFASGADLDEVGPRIAERTGARAMLGCTAGGVIGGGRGVEGVTAVSVWAAVLPEVRLRTFHLEVMRSQEGMAVVGLPERVDDEVAVLLADPSSFPADGFISRANTSLEGLPIVGGMASGQRGPGETRLWVDGRTALRGAVGVLLAGDVRARTIVSQGCRPVGPAMTVTAAAGNVVQGLAGQGAMSKVQQLLGDLSPEDQALASHGLQLGIAMDEYAEEHDFLVRAILGTEPESGGIVVGDLVEVGSTVRLQIRDADAADADLRSLLLRFRNETHDAPVGGALLFSCNGRGAAMFGPTHGGADHDERLVRAELAAQGVAGFFAGGEIGPVAGRNHLHGFTASILTFGA